MGTRRTSAPSGATRADAGPRPNAKTSAWRRWNGACQTLGIVSQSGLGLAPARRVRTGLLVPVCIALSSAATANAEPEAAEWHPSDAGRQGAVREQPPFAAEPSASALDQRQRDARRRDRWLLSVGGVTHAPLDIGFQVGVETPLRLRLFASYGWVPSFYFGVLTGIARSATEDARAEALLESADYSGNAWRVQAGFRPWASLGLYFDAGYSRVNLETSLDLAELELFGTLPVSGGYASDSTLDLWLIELGYQDQVGERLVLGVGLGVVGTLDARTTVRPTGEAPDDPALSDAARRVDDALETYGIVPTLTLRLGFDMI